jgi:GntR family transcriptional regulator
MSRVSTEDRPVYLRLRDLIAAMILEGKVREGDALPSVRSLAAEYGANPLTVAKAYQTFQDEGLVTVRRGVGMFVAEGAVERLRETERRDFLENRWPTIAAQIRRLGLNADDLIERALA